MNASQSDRSIEIEERKQLLAVLEDEQRRSGYVSEDFLADIAQSLGLPVGDVYGVATFYSFLSTRPLGRHVIRICKSISCHLKNAEMIKEAVKKEIGIAPGETTADNRFSFEATNCIGACDHAPAMLVDNDVHGHLNPEKIAEILQNYD
jgi:NADH-quinone oxidoreductase E subunit